MTKTYKAGDKIGDMTYLCRLDDEVFLVAPMAPKKMNWDDAMKYAADRGLELPDLDITQIMFKRKNEGAFKGSYGDAGFLWTARRASKNNAYYQWLDDGYENHSRRTCKLSVRAVRRLSISDLVGAAEPPDDLDITHASDCAMHNEPAYPNGPCDCGALKERKP